MIFIAYIRGKKLIFLQNDTNHLSAEGLKFSLAVLQESISKLVLTTNWCYSRAIGVNEFLHNCFLHNLLNLRGRRKNEVKVGTLVYLPFKSNTLCKKSSMLSASMNDIKTAHKQRKEDGWGKMTQREKNPQQHLNITGKNRKHRPGKMHNLPHVWGSQAVFVASPHLWNKTQIINQSFTLQIHDKNVKKFLEWTPKTKVSRFYLFEEPSWFFRSSLRIAHMTQWIFKSNFLTNQQARWYVNYGPLLNHGQKGTRPNHSICLILTYSAEKNL